METHNDNKRGAGINEDVVDAGNGERIYSASVGAYTRAKKRVWRRISNLTLADTGT